MIRIRGNEKKDGQTIAQGLGFSCSWRLSLITPDAMGLVSSLLALPTDRLLVCDHRTVLRSF